MRKALRQIFLFLIPTLTVALVFIPLSQQNIFYSDDSDSVAAAINIDAPAKHLNHNVFTPVFLFADRNESLPELLVVGSVFVFAILLKPKNVLCEIRNHSPPLGVKALAKAA